MNSKLNWDVLGVSASIACAIHCAVLPLLISSLPIFGVNIINNVAFEYVMILLAFAVGSFSLFHGYRKHHRSFVPVLLFAIGILFLFAKQVWHEYQFWLLPFAVVFIVSAHIRNFRLSRVSLCDDEKSNRVQSQ
ncbi:MAG: MerC domain-containing protein [Bacteroidetes bacterium]|nr:MerC domain-containing protein [Bacteroidota bacterium]